LRSDNLDSVGEFYAEDDFRQLVVAIGPAVPAAGSVLGLHCYLRAQRPVADVPGVAHFVPLIAPLAQTKLTMDRSPLMSFADLACKVRVIARMKPIVASACQDRCAWRRTWPGKHFCEKLSVLYEAAMDTHREWSPRDIEIFRKALRRGASINEAARLLARDGRDIWAKGTELGFVVPRKDEEPIHSEERAEKLSATEKQYRSQSRARKRSARKRT
jgi:hypothetical protein